MSEPRILIVGAGIGGLTAAIALRRLGLDVEVVERAPAFAPIGAGITIQANAKAIFDALDLEIPASEGVAIGHFEMINEKGQILMSGDPSESPSGERGVSSLNMHRADLSRVLVDACTAPLHMGRGLTSLSQDPEGVDVGFADGTSGRWDLVVGFDGIHSTTRRLLLGESPLRYSGQTCWRFAVEASDLMPERTVERWTPGRRCGMVPLSRGRIYTYLVSNAPQGTPGPGTDTCDALHERFSGLDERLDLLLDRLDERTPIHHGDLSDQPQIHFGAGRVVLLGDASHAMTPNMGQGAGSAIEDAAALSVLLPDHLDDLSALPGAIDALRRARVAKLLKSSWQIGQMAHVEHPAARWLRDLALRMTPKSFSDAQMDTIWRPGLALAEQLRAACADASALG